MQLFKRAEKPGQAANPPLDGSITSAPHTASQPAADDTDKNDISLARTRTEDIVYPSGIKLALLLLSTFVSMFLVALDRLIISTAIPQITDDFHSATDIGWYGSAYMLTNCAFQLSFGKLYTFYSVKTVFLTAIALFEIGSAICGAAPNSVAFIVGRAIAGVGSGGIFSGTIVVITYAVPLHKRPLYQGLFGAVFGIASVIGPLLGGAFTSNVTWRWCFYINLPFGGVAMLCIFFLLKVPDRPETHMRHREKLAQLDFLGISFLLPGVICLLLALQWGGSKYDWNNGRIIALLVLSGVLLIAFVVTQAFKGDAATVPPRIFLQRSIISGAWATFCLGSSMMIFVYYLPIWFQAIESVSAVDSGIRLLAMVLPMVVSSIGSGVLIARIGYYTPFILFGTVLLSIGAGLLTTLQLGTGRAMWIGYQVIYGFGMGCTFQAPNLAAQTVLANKDVAIGSSIMFFMQQLGGAIFTSVGSNVLSNELVRRLTGVDGINAVRIVNAGATEILNGVADSLKTTVLSAYNESLRSVFQVGLAMTCLIIFGALGMEWRSVKSKKPGAKGPDADAEKDAVHTGDAGDGRDSSEASDHGKPRVVGDSSIEQIKPGSVASEQAPEPIVESKVETKY